MKRGAILLVNASFSIVSLNVVNYCTKVLFDSFFIRDPRIAESMQT
jgi:hypothetical protein